MSLKLTHVATFFKMTTLKVFFRAAMLPKEQVFLNIEELSSMISSQLLQQVPHQVPLPPKFNQDILRRSSTFVITRMITGRIGLHSVLLPLLITLFNKVSSNVNSLLELRSRHVLIDFFLLQEICKLTVLILLNFFHKLKSF